MVTKVRIAVINMFTAFCLVALSKITTPIMDHSGSVDNGRHLWVQQCIMKCEVIGTCEVKSSNGKTAKDGD